MNNLISFSTSKCSLPLLRSIVYAFTFTVTAAFGSIQMQAQTVDSTILWFIEIEGGNEFTGHILSETSSTIAFRSKSLGLIQINKSTIRKKEEISIDDIKADGVWLDNQ